MGFPERLKALRLEANLTQKDIAQTIGISQPAYADWEKGKKKPTPDKLPTIAKIFNVSTDFLLGNTNNVEEDELADVEMLFRATSLNMSDEEKAIFKQELLEFMKERQKLFDEDKE
ncbi:TPA: helix-turn-helix domain-containing protein [Streptococcus suis]